MAVNLFTCNVGVGNTMRLDPIENRKRIKRLLADIGIDAEIIAQENKEIFLKFKADRLAIETALWLVRQKPCKWN